LLKSSFVSVTVLWLLIVVVFFLDSLTPLGFAHGFLYLPLLAFHLFLSKRHVFVIPVAILALTWIGIFISASPPNGLSFSYVIGNRLGSSLSMLAIWLLHSIYLNNVSKVKHNLTAELGRQKVFEALAESLPIQIWTANLAGEVDYVGTKLEKFTGRSKTEIQNNWLSVVHPSDHEHSVKAWLTSVHQHTPYEVEFRIINSEGEPIWHLTRATLELDSEGVPKRWLGSSIDIDAVKKLQQQSKTNEDRFLLISKATNDAIWDWDLIHNQLWWNEAFHRVFAHKPSTIDFGAHSWIDHIYSEDQARVLDSIHSVIDGNENQWMCEYRFVHADGTPRLVMDRGFVIRNKSGKAIRMLGSMLDITEQRELEQRLNQSQKLEAIGHLTGGVAHDFNNLLTVILGNSALLAEQLINQPQLKVLADMTQIAAERGAELTSRLLAFARKQPLQPKILDINKLVVGLEGLLRRTVTENIELELARSAGLWTTEADPNQLEAAIINLVINARDAMPSGGKLTIETANTRLDEEYASGQEDVIAGQYVLLSVSDTGTGMDKEVLAKAFDPFFTTKDIGKGSGLGLSMVYGFMKQSGGHAKIYSEPSHGTSVKLYFPRFYAEHTDNTVSTLQHAPRGHEHILVAEDDEFVRKYLVGLLIDMGYKVSEATNGVEALAMLKNGLIIDLLFTDIVMPGGMNGRELADLAVKLSPGLKVLFTSGYTENAVVHHGRLDAGVHLLSKPYRRQELAVKLRKVLDG
jgi:PAS domain S-box-containing protein